MSVHSPRPFKNCWPRISAIALAAAALVQVSAKAVTVGNPSSPGGLQQAIIDAYNGGATQITIAPGVYSLTGVLNINSMSNVVIDATNVELIPPNTNAGTNVVHLQNDTNLTFKGATMHYAAPTTVQGTILDIGADSTGNYVDLHLHAGYSTDATRFQDVAYIFDQNTRQWKVGCGDSYGNTAAAGPNGSARIYLKSKYSATAVGDFVVGRGPCWHFFQDDNCTNCTFSNLTVYWGGLFQYLENNGSGNHFLNCKVTWGPAPAGAQVAPLISATADAFHSIGCTVGPDVENCTFEGMPDDAISIRGTYEAIYQVVDSTHLVIKGGNFVAGDSMSLQNNASSYFAGNTCTAVATIATPPGAPSGTYHQLTLQTAVAPPAGSYVYDSSRIGSGFKVIGNTINYNRARGIRILGSNGVVQNNVINGSTLEAVRICPEYGSEAGVAQGVQVSGNTIIGTGLLSPGVGAIHADPGTAVTQNLTITGNTLTGVFGNNYIKLAHTNGNTVSNNTIVGPSSVDFSASGPLIALASTTANITVSHNVAKFETEDLAIGAYSGPTPRIFTDGACSNGAGVIIDATAVGQSMSLVVPGVAAATYDIKLGLKNFNTRGIFQFAIGPAGKPATNLGSPIDEYTATQSFPLVDLGNWTPGTTSDKWFQYTVTGKNAASAGYTIAVDYIDLAQP